MKSSDIIAVLDSMKPRSKWNQGVRDAAIGMIEDVQNELDNLSDDADYRQIDKVLLNGAADWTRYSWDGNALIYNGDIAAAYMTPSELRRYKRMNHDPSMGFNGESLLDMQARALHQACLLIHRVIRELR